LPACPTTPSRAQLGSRPVTAAVLGISNHEASDL
jgi:hypothetical protein